MADIKIGVGGDVGAAKAALNVMTAAANDMAKAIADANKTPFKAVGLEQAAKDIARLNKGFQDAIKLSASLRNALKNSGQNPDAGIFNIDWTRTGLDPNAAQKLRNRAFSYAARGTAWDQTNVPASPPAPASGGASGGASGSGSGGGGVGRRPTREDDDGPGLGSRMGHAVLRGVGGPVGQIGGEALDGASSGAAAGGVMGGAAGMVKGGLIGIGLAAAMKLGQMGTEGYSMARDRDLGLDTLKRQMGDLGVSFDELKRMSEAASDGLGVNAQEFAQLEQQQLTASSGFYRHPVDVADATRASVGFAHAYGMDPSQAVAAFGSMQRGGFRDPHQLAADIAEAIEHAGNKALPAEVLQALQQVTTTSARLALSIPNIGAAGSAYASMLQNGGPGMTPSTALGIISQSNSAVSNMGAAGEAGQNFTYQALQAQGSLSPIEAMALSAGGMFGTRDNVFGAGTDLGQYMAENGLGDELKRLRGNGEQGSVTNFDALKDKLNRDFKDPMWRLNAAQRFFGVSSPQQAAALMRMDDKDFGGLSDSLNRAGVGLGDVNESGLRTLASIGRAKTPEELNKVYADITARTGAGSLSADERSHLDSMKASGNEDAFKDALIKVMAGKEQQETTGSDIRKSTASLENIQIALGDKIVPAINDIRDAVLFSVGKGAGMTTPASLEKSVHDAVGRGGTASSFFDAYSGSNSKGWLDSIKSWVYSQGWDGQHAETIAEDEQKYGLPTGLLKGVWGAETTFGHNVKRSSTGAEGNFQAEPSTQRQYGIDVGNFDSEADGAARQLRDLLKKHNGDIDATLFDYNGVVHNVDAGRTYVSNVRKFAGATLAAGGADKSAIPGWSGYGTIETLPPDGGSAAIDKLPLEHKKSSAGSGIGSRSSEGVTDKIVLDMNMNVVRDGAYGQKVTDSVSTSVTVPRGSGTHVVSANLH